MTEAHSLVAARQLFVRYGDASGLLLDPVNPSAGQAGPVIYICDVESSRSLLLETAQDALHKLSERAELDEPAYEKIRAAFLILLGDLLSSTQAIHPDTRRGVIFGAAFCVSETRGFNITRHHGKEVQHVLLRYPDAVTDKHRLTPMPVFKSHPIMATELEATVNHMLLSEQLNFPERFPAHPPTQFRQVRRNVLSGKI